MPGEALGGRGWSADPAELFHEALPWIISLLIHFVLFMLLGLSTGLAAQSIVRVSVDTVGVHAGADTYTGYQANADSHGAALSGGGRDARHVGVSAPTDDVRVLLRLLLLALETSPPEAPVETVVLATEGRPKPRDQLDLFLPRGPDPAALDRTLSELASLCGEDRVGAPLGRWVHPEGYE